MLFERAGRRFELVDTDRAGDCMIEAHVDRSMVAGDLDLDGDMDLAIGELNGPLRVLANDGAGKGDWLIVELRERDGVGNRHAIGAMVVLTQGSTQQRRWIVGGGGFQSTSAQYAHFGLGAAAAEVAITITWPDGVAQTIEGVEPNQHLIVRRD
jgi:hypothetical protein